MQKSLAAVASVAVGVSAVMLGAHPAAGAPQTQTIALAGQNHVYTYDSRASAARRDAVAQAVTETLPAYNALFGINNVELHFELKESPAPGKPRLLAEAGHRVTATPGAEGCVMKVYKPSGAQPAGLVKLTIAHELVHCYQAILRVPMRTQQAGMPAIDPDAWWIEGSAEYLATTRYPPVGQPISGTLSGFASIVTQTIFDVDYQQYWFFAFWAHARGPSAVVNLIRNMPMANSGEARDEVLRRQRGWLESVQPTADMFGNYAAAALQRRLPRQPRWSGPTYRVAAGGSQRMVLSPLAIDTAKLALPRPPRDQGLLIKLVEGSDKGYRAMSSLGAITPQGLSTCGHATPAELAIALGRGAFDDGDNVNAASLRVEIDECAPLGMATIAGTYTAQTSQMISFFLPLPSSGSYRRFNETYANMQIGSRPNDVTIGLDGRMTGNLTGTQTQGDSYISFRNSAVSGHFTLGRVLAKDANHIRWAIHMDTPLNGIGRGAGGTSRPDGTTVMNSNMTMALRFAVPDALECQFRDVDGKPKCDLIVLTSGDAPMMELGEYR